MTAVFMFRVINNLMPTAFQDMFLHIFNVHSYITRQANSLYIPRYRTTRCKFAIKCHGPIVWNTIPNYLQTISSLYLFKRKLKMYLIGSV